MILSYLQRLYSILGTVGVMFLSILVVCSNASAEPATNAITPLGKAVENWNPNRMSVGGGYFRAVRTKHAAPLHEGLVTAWLPETLAGQEICLNVQGDNGSYQGTQRLQVAGNWAGGVASVPLASNYMVPPLDLHDLKASEAYARLEVGSCSEFKDELVLLVTTWKQELTEQPRELELLLKAPDETRVRIRAFDKTQPCNRVLLTAAGFNIVCSLTAQGSSIGFEVLLTQLKEDLSGTIRSKSLTSIFGQVRLQ